MLMNGCKEKVNKADQKHEKDSSRRNNINVFKQSPSSEASSFSASQETSRILWNPKVH
jgi:hypothetical protein